MLSGRFSFASRMTILKTIENNVGGQDASLLDAIADGETTRQRSTVLHLILLTFTELAEDGDTFLGDSQGVFEFRLHHD